MTGADIIFLLIVLALIVGSIFGIKKFLKWRRNKRSKEKKE